MKKFFTLLLAIIAVILPTIVQADYHPLAKNNILLLHSYHKSYDWTERIDQGIRDVFKAKGIAVEFKTEYMDTKNYNSEQYFKYLYQLYKEKYNKKNFDLIIVSDDYGLDLLLKYKDEIFPKTPVVFCGINNYEKVLPQLNNNYTGVVEKINFEASIDTALKLHPKMNKIIALTDKSISGSENVALIDEALAQHFNEIDYKIHRLTKISRVEKLIQNLDKKTIVLLAGIFKDSNNNLIPPEKIAEILSSQTRQPIYSTWDFYLNHGIVGGKLVSGYYHGSKAATMGTEILQGVKPADVDIAKEEATKYMFDAKELKRFGITEKELPKNSIIINQEKSYYELHKRLVWGIGLGSLLLISIIIALSINIIKRREAEDKLKDSNRQLEYQLKLEELIALLSTEFISLDFKNLDQKMNQSLRQIGEFLKVDRSYIFLIDYTKEEMNNIWEWSATGVESQIDELQNLPLDVFPWVMEKLSNLENILVDNVDELPSEAENLKEILKEQDIKSVILIPIRGKENIIGYWGVDAVKEQGVWNKAIINLLKIVAEIFGNTLQQKNYHSKLEESQERLKLALWGANVGLWDWNIKTDKVHFNQQWARMLGYDLSELTKDVSTWKKFIHPEDKEETISKLKSHLEGETDYYESEHRLKTKAGNWKWVLDKGRIVSKNEAGEPLRAVGVHIDITKRKELSNLKSELISTVSHEIRTPLASVLGFTELLLARDLSAETREKYLKMIHRESNRLRNLINDFLDIQKIEEGRQDFQFTQVDITEIVYEVVDLYQLHAKREFEFDFASEKIEIEADYNKLKQVFTNLISNAVKYSEQDTTIKIEIEEGEDLVKVAVIDHGLGISKENHDDLFQKFYRAKESVENQIEGTGLGLAICKKIIEVHQGEIWFDSELGKGSTFYFTIPKES